MDRLKIGIHISEARKILEKYDLTIVDTKSFSIFNLMEDWWLGEYLENSKIIR